MSTVRDALKNARVQESYVTVTAPEKMKKTGIPIEKSVAYIGANVRGRTFLFGNEHLFLFEELKLGHE
ncbi:MAG TPA: hypothetical protein VK574_02900 [Terracidiphilus sp.]|jgi:hypothetical protein|nr:hypothetical protein [Terracidiphilus sp.]